MSSSRPPVSRRDFLSLAGKAGLALSILEPALDGLTGVALHAQGLDAPADDTTAHALAPAARDAVPTLQAPVAPALFDGLRWRHIGPFRGGRVAAVSGVPGKPNEFYFGAVNGGVWKSVDAGRVWAPVSEAMPVASIGALAVAPSRTDTIYVGSGESTLRDSSGYGNGLYKSVDAGATWTHLGLDATHHIGRIAIDPKNPDIVFVAAIGQLYAPNAERGVFRTRDGGTSWQKVLFRNNDIGAVDVVIDPNDSRVVYAALWNTRRPPWFTYAPTNGPGGGIFKSTDGGTTWTALTNGLPAAGIGRCGLAVAPTDSKRVYAVVDCLVPDPAAPTTPGPPQSPPGGPPPAPRGQGGFFRSDDAGATWTRLSSDQALWGRGWYFEKVAVDPRNADIVYVPNVAVNRSKDGGATWVALRGSPGGDDYHQPWISPDDSDTMIVASDQGAIVTRNARADEARDVTWSSWLNQPTAQLYHIAVDHRTPYWVTGAQQDSGAVAVCSHGKFGTITMRDWEPIGAGGESGFTAGDPLHPGVIYGEMGSRHDLMINAAVPGTTSPKAPEKLRADWTQPLVLSKADPRALYYAAQYLFKSTDGAATWRQISPDLTRLDVVIPATLDAAAAAHVDRNDKRGVIYTVSPSPLLVPMVWIGTDDGLIQVSANDGRTWQNVTPSSVLPWSRVTMIEASHSDFRCAYASVDRHQLQDYEPYIYRTRDMGATWQKITVGLPAGVYVHTIKEDPSRPGLLFAGTERGAFISFDDGDHWQPLRLNMPVTSVRDFEIHKNDLIVGTHGRGIWIIDDISVLRQISDAVIASGVHLFTPSDIAYMMPGDDNGTPTQKDEPHAENPANGVYIDYYLAANATTPVTIDILDATGAVVHTVSSAATLPAAAAAARGGNGIPNVSPLWRTPAAAAMSARAGMHRVVWAPIADAGHRRDGVGTPLVGAFTARLTVNGQVKTQTFTVKPDPRLVAR